MVPGACFYILSAGKTGHGSNWAIGVATEDAYAPATTGIYNIALEEFKGLAAKNRQQMWYFDAEHGTINSMARDDGVLFEGFNKNLIVYKYQNMDNQKFRYLEVLKEWENISTGNVFDLEAGWAQGATVITNDKNEMSFSQKWDIEYCDEDHRVSPDGT